VPGHGDALLRPAGQLGRQVAGPLAEPDLFQGLPGSLAALGRLIPRATRAVSAFACADRVGLG
jgi:hypothetical protein